LALKSGKEVDKQIADIDRATNFFRSQQSAKTANKISLKKTRRILTYSFVGTKKEAIVAFYPTSQRWEHRTALHLRGSDSGKQKRLIDDFIEDVERTERDADAVT
jgi:hypothetical protein